VLTNLPDVTVLGDEQLRDRIAADLERARLRTMALTGVVDEPELVRQHSPIMSPLVWDMTHIGNQEELWLLHEVAHRDMLLSPEVNALYDAFRHPRRDRPSLPLLDPGQSRRYISEVRNRVVDMLERARFDGDPLTDRGFVFGMIAQHEQQHDETMLATHNLRAGQPVLDAPPPVVSEAIGLPAEVLVPGGPFEMGTSVEPWALDNERPAHAVAVEAFWVDTAPVTNAAYQRFIDDGGYDDPRFWTAEGWRHRQGAGLTAPLSWRREGGLWLRTRFGHVEPVPPDEPVQHVCWYEADAYARWAGKRLPTEAEWEKAARWDPVTGRSRRYPWGDENPTPERANLSGRHLRPAPVGAYPRGASPLGVHQLIGDVWEWTSSDFSGYPGFVAFPYREYSEVFFGSDYKVLRGGSWAVDPVACRGTFRNWDYPIRRQIFCGFRCARDAHTEQRAEAEPATRRRSATRRTEQRAEAAAD
jgi:iron(II)-dependent oxidoreductase